MKKMLISTCITLLLIPMSAQAVEYGGEIAVAKRNFSLIQRKACGGDSDCRISELRVVGNWAWIIMRGKEWGGSGIMKYNGHTWVMVTGGGGAISPQDAIAKGVPRSVTQQLFPIMLYFTPNERLSRQQLSYANEWDLLVARNLVYARHGRKFTYAPLAQYFKGFSWYKPNSHYHDGMLTATDKHNIQLISQIEKEKGFR